MIEQLPLQDFLRNRFFELQVKNPSYSLRAFAKKVGLAPSALSEILRGRRRVSRNIVERIAKRLLLDPQETHRLTKDFSEKGNRKRPASPSAEASREYLRLSADQFHLISEWTHYAILSLIRTSDFESSPEWMAERLGVIPAKIKSAIERLERLGLIDRGRDGSLRRTYAKVHTPDDVLSASIQRAHLGDMEIAKSALELLPVDLRDFTSITFPTHPRVLPEAKARIRKFREEMCELFEAAPPAEVFQMSIYVYPVTRTRP